MFRAIQYKRHASILGMALVASSAFAGIHTPVTPSWTRPTTNTEAANTLTTYQQWDSILSTATSTPAGPNAPTTVVNPNSTGSLTDNIWDTAYPSDGAFAAGTDIYSFSGVLNPEIDIAGYGISGNQLNVVVELQTLGSAIDTSLLTVNGVAASSLPGYSTYEAYNDGGSTFGGFGTAYLIDNVWTFTTTDTSQLKLNFGWGVTSAAFQGALVDTRSFVAPVPEPASMAALGMGALALLRRRRAKASR